MAITNDLRKTFGDPTPLYFAAGTADLALRQAWKVPELVEQLCAEAPARIEAVRRTDPKELQDRAAARARDVQETIQKVVNDALGSLDTTDLKKLGESAQGIALRGVGVALEYAVKARETYERVAEHGEQTLRGLRGEQADGDAAKSRSVPAPGPAEPTAARDGDEGTGPTGAPGSGTAAEPAGRAPSASSEDSPAAARRTTAKKATARKTTARRTTAGRTAPRQNGTRKSPPSGADTEG